MMVFVCGGLLCSFCWPIERCLGQSMVPPTYLSSCLLTSQDLYYNFCMSTKLATCPLRDIANYIWRCRCQFWECAGYIVLNLQGCLSQNTYVWFHQLVFLKNVCNLSIFSIIAITFCSPFLCLAAATQVLESINSYHFYYLYCHLPLCCMLEPLKM